MIGVSSTNDERSIKFVDFLFQSIFTPWKLNPLSIFSIISISSTPSGILSNSKLKLWICSTLSFTCFLGKKEETAYYFIYDKSAETTLDYDLLSEIKTKSQQYVIYADNCLLAKEFMMANNIVFKKIPRDVTRF